MVKGFFDILKKKGLLKQSLGLVDQMFEVNKEMFLIAVEGVEKGEPVKKIVKPCFLGGG